MAYGPDPRETCWIEDLDVYDLIDRYVDEQDEWEIDLGCQRNRGKFDAFGWIEAIDKTDCPLRRRADTWYRMQDETVLAITRRMVGDREGTIIDGAEGIMILTYRQWWMVLTALDATPGRNAAIEWGELQELISCDIRDNMYDRGEA